MSRRADSYDPRACTPRAGSRWIWEIDEPHAMELVKVTEVKWNGEEWWVRTTSLLRSADAPAREGSGQYWNDLSRFCEAVTPVGAAVPGTWIHREGSSLEGK